MHPVLDTEGRLACVDLAGLQLWSCYAPSGASKEERLALKHEYLRRLVRRAVEVGATRPIVLGGDLNVAHTPLDVEGHEPRSRPGLLPVERAVFDALAGAGWTDLVRAAAPQQPGPYTWRSRSRGWRLDHIWASPASSFGTPRVELGPS